MLTPGMLREVAKRLEGQSLPWSATGSEFICPSTRYLYGSSAADDLCALMILAGLESSVGTLFSALNDWSEFYAEHAYGTRIMFLEFLALYLESEG